MSRHRIKDVDYDDDDFYDDEDAPADPEEQEFLQQCTTAVLQQLGAGQPSVTATKEEVQDALWHYYNDIEKSVNYLKGMFNWRRYAASNRIIYRGFPRSIVCCEIQLTEVLRAGKREKEATKLQKSKIQPGKQCSWDNCYPKVSSLGSGSGPQDILRALIMTAAVPCK